MQYFFGIYLQDQHLRCDLICLKVLENVSIFNNAIRLMKSLVSLVLSFAKCSRTCYPEAQVVASNTRGRLMISARFSI